MASRFDPELCSKCGRVTSVEDHMNPGSTTVFKWCKACRERGRARSNLRRERKKAILQSFTEQLQSQPPQITQYLLNSLVGDTRSAFSRRNPSFLVLNPPQTSVRTEDTLSSTLESAETDSTLSQGEESLETCVTEPDSASLPGNEKEAKEEENSDQAQPSSNTPGTTSPYFMCIHCNRPRRIALAYSEVCIYCLEHQQKFCIHGEHEADQPDFVDEDGEEHAACIRCRERESPDEEGDDDNHEDDEDVGN